MNESWAYGYDLEANPTHHDKKTPGFQAQKRNIKFGQGESFIQF